MNEEAAAACVHETEETEPVKSTNMKPGAVKLRNWLNKTLRIEMFDDRVLIGIFLCTDRDANVILGSCTEHLPVENASEVEEPRMLGLVMIPGKHIKTVCIDENSLDPMTTPRTEENSSQEIT